MSIDKQITLTKEQLSGLGMLDPPRAMTNLELLSASLGPDRSLIDQSFFTELAHAADPDTALNNVERFVGGLRDIPRFIGLCRKQPAVLRLLIAICGASRFLSAFIMTDADETLERFAERDYLAHPAGRPALRQRLAALTAGADDRSSLLRALRIFRKREMLRIGLRDLLGSADLRETVAELSDLAEVCLQQAYETVDAELSARYGRPWDSQDGSPGSPAGFAVVAMGKLGGRELNFSSDVDLMYVYSVDGETTGAGKTDGLITSRITNHQYFIKLAERLSSLINEKTGDGFVFRVDLRLRPEGQQGPLAQSLGGYEIYYESWGQTWERSALVKARPVAGDEATGREFVERITPFVYRKYLDYSAIAEIGDMKRKINHEVELKGRTHRDVKLGYGGIREIEFIIQTLQLLHGGRDRSLREKSSLKALHHLSQKGLITYEEQEILAKAYVFLRTVEHRIQILDDLQTQTMPAEERELRTLARRTGYRDSGREAETLLRDYGTHTDRVRHIYDDLFAFAGREGAEPEEAGRYARLLDPETTEQDAIALLLSLGFRDPVKAHRDVLLLREGPALVHQTPRSRKLFTEIFPPLFGEILSSPDPDLALHHLESFLAAQGSWEALQSLVKVHASSAKVLIAVFASSEYLSRMLISRPHFLQNMLETKKHAGRGALVSYARDLDDQLAGLPGTAEKLDCIRRFKHLEEIRIGMADLLSGAGQRTVSRQLARLADVCLGAALSLAGEEIGKRYDAPRTTTGLAIIAAGKLGGRELTYGSDLDILFVYSEAGAAAPSAGMSVYERFSKVAEKTISFLSTMTREGFVFRVDTRLRPTGSKGPLVQSVDACRNYYAAEAEIWELQSLLRARFAAGDRSVGLEFCGLVKETIFRGYDPLVLASEIRTMRRRMEEELGREDAGQYNIKQGRGGIVDIEFLVQYLLLLHGRPSLLRAPGTLNALHSLHKERAFEPSEYRVLCRAYLFLRMLESRMRISENQASSMLKKDAASLHGLARRLGYRDAASPAGAQLLSDYEAITKQVRMIFNQILPNP